MEEMKSDTPEPDDDQIEKNSHSRFVSNYNRTDEYTNFKRLGGGCRVISRSIIVGSMSEA